MFTHWRNLQEYLTRKEVHMKKIQASVHLLARSPWKCSSVQFSSVLVAVQFSSVQFRSQFSSGSTFIKFELERCHVSVRCVRHSTSCHSAGAGVASRHRHRSIQSWARARAMTPRSSWNRGEPNPFQCSQWRTLHVSGDRCARRGRLLLWQSEGDLK